MRTPNGLTVIECRYNYNGWSVDCTGGHPVYSSQLKFYEHPRAVDLYHRANSYGVMGVPVEICEADYGQYEARYPQPCLGVTRAFSDAVFQAVSKGNAVLAAGGFCNYAPAIVGGIQRALGTEKTIGVVWIDAHADCRIAETSPKPEHFVGLPMSLMLGLTLDDFRRDICGLAVPCRGDHIVGGDMRIMDEQMASVLSAEGVHWLDTTAFNCEAMWDKAVNELAGKVDAIYLSVDADILKPSDVPAYFKPVPYGNDIETVKRNIRSVMATGKVCAFSAFCFDFDRYEHGGERTSASGREIVEAGLGSWKQVPER